MHKPDNQPQSPSLVHISNFVHPIFRSAYAKHVRQRLSLPGESRTKQEFKDECDINTILKRYQATGLLTHANERSPIYADVTQYDFQAAMELVANAKSEFALLPSAIRARFDNDPGKLLAFVHDPRNRDEAVEMGFLDATKLPAKADPSATTKAPASAAPGAPQQAAAPGSPG